MEYVLSEEDICLCREAVEDLDEDGSGEISVFDFETALRRLDLHLEEFDLCRLISDLDASNRGVITFEQLMEVYRQKR